MVEATPAPPRVAPRRAAPLVALAGNPNTGKTTLFNRLTGSRARVGNYPGVTVERLEGRVALPDERHARLVDVPGTYSLCARSEEEGIAIRAVTGLAPMEPPDAVVCVVDATQCLRNLYLVLQLVELDLPVVVALNMIDLAGREGPEVDAAAIQAELGVPVVPVSAKTGFGLDRLRRAVAEVLDVPARGRGEWRWGAPGEELALDVERVGRDVPEAWHGGSERRRRALALWALLSLDEDDELEDVPPSLRAAVLERRAAADTAGREIDEEVIRGRYEWIEERAERFARERVSDSPSRTDRVDRVLLHPTLGFALFLAIMTIVFQSLFTWADPVIGLVESAFAALGDGARAVLPPGVLTDLLVEGVIGGVGSVVVFLPQILLLFLFIGLMEDTGYMARVAYLMDRVMKSVGLHGRAFVPMLSGYACAVPAILATRTMERRRDRLLTMMVVPLMTCSARLPVYALLIAALVPVGSARPFTQGMLLAGMYVFATLLALACAAVLGRTLFRGPRVPLILEMPPYRVPHWPSVLRMMVQRSGVFVREAGTVILACTIAIWALLSFPREPALDRDFEAERAAVAAAAVPGADARLAALDAEEEGARLRASYGGRLGHLVEPAIEPLGFDWKIGIGLVGAFAAREVFVSTMAVVYGVGDQADETSIVLRDRIREERHADGSLVFTPLVCFSLMVFFAIACQCMSTLAVVRRETAGWRWPTFLFAYTGVLAWVASFAVYQGGRVLGLE